jgi:isopentenyl-diphosphate Delta-isomerase
MDNEVILVDERDVAIGVSEKLLAHQKGLLHRAFSVFVFNPKGELLIQKRAKGKYHSAGLWSNTCCSHPRPGEETLTGAHRRLQEEMGFDCELQTAGALIYTAQVGNGLTENEYDHIFLGEYEGATEINLDEVSESRWVDPQVLLLDMKNSPEKYTYWFKLSLEDVLAKR